MATCLVSCFLLSGCNGQKQIDSETVKTVKVEEQAHLQDDTVSPACKITIDYSYLAESDAADSIAQRINRTIQAHVLGKEYIRMNPEVAVDSFKNTYINNYRKDVNEFYQEDIKNGTPKDELPTWYNYEYGLTTHFSEGKEGILNFIAETFEYTGGAHPNSWNKWMNFEKNTGKLLALKDVFMAGSEKTDERHVAGRTDNRDGYPSGRQLHHLTGRTSECRHLEFYQYVRTRQFLVRKGKSIFPV